MITVAWGSVRSGEGVEVSEIHCSLSIAFWQRNYDGCLAEGVGVTGVPAMYMMCFGGGACSMLDRDGDHFSFVERKNAFGCL